MGFDLTFKNLDNNFTLKSQTVENFDKIKAEFETVKEACKPTASLSFLMVSRVDTWKNLAKDLFLPTFINRALRVENLVGAIFASFFAIILDLATLPFRLLTLGPVYSERLNHPLSMFLKKYANEEFCDVDDMEIELDWTHAETKVKYSISFFIFLDQIYRSTETSSL